MNLGGVGKVTNSLGSVLNSQIFGWLLIGAGVVFAFKLSKKVGKKIDETTIAISNVGATLSINQAKTIAKNILNSWGFFNDDEEAIYANMNKIQNYKDLQMVIECYALSGRDLYNDFRDKLNSGERSNINKILLRKNINFQF